MKTYKRGFGTVEVLVIILVIVLIGACGWLVYDRQKGAENNGQAVSTSTETQKEEAQTQEESKPSTLVKGTFGDSGEYGTLQAEGYVTTVKLSEGFCEENCKQYDYLFFNISKTENTNIFNYLKSISGNSFVQDKAIGMGCVDDGKITYSNSSDSKGMQAYSVSTDDTAAILAATAEKPIILELERLQYSGGGGAPDCYSHFTTFTVVQQ